MTDPIPTDPRTGPRADVAPDPGGARRPPLAAGKFRDPRVTAAGVPRAAVALHRLETLWVNTGTLCNLECAGCYIQSSPRNDRLAYLRAAEFRPFLDEIARDRLPVDTIGFTGGEPFMNPDILVLLDDALSRGMAALVLTNAMTPLSLRRDGLADLGRRFGDKLRVRVSLDHYTAAGHERIRGPNSWEPALGGLAWLAANGFRLSIAGRGVTGESEGAMRRGYARLLGDLDLPLDPNDPEALTIFPDMDETRDVPEITEACWAALGVDPASIMCATSRMVVKRKGAARPTVVSCTLLPYDPAFDLGPTLRDASRAVTLNHPHCARFCVLGGASCG